MLVCCEGYIPKTPKTIGSLHIFPHPYHFGAWKLDLHLPELAFFSRGLSLARSLFFRTTRKILLWCLGSPQPMTDRKW